MDRSGNNGGWHQLPSAIVPGETLQLITTYNDCAGQSVIAGVETDDFGNARGAHCELGVDGAFEGMQVGVTKSDLLSSPSWRDSFFWCCISLTT